MADWRKLALTAFLADGKINESAVKILRKELYADKKVRHDEMQFLIELRGLALKKAKAKKEELLPSFEKLFFKAVEDSVLDNGRISEVETKFLRGALFAGGKVTGADWKFLESIKKKAKDNIHPDFTKYYNEIAAKVSKLKTAKAASKA